MTLDFTIGAAGDGEIRMKTAFVAPESEPVSVTVSDWEGFGGSGAVGRVGSALLNAPKAGVVSRLIICEANGALRTVESKLVRKIPISEAGIMRSASLKSLWL